MRKKIEAIILMGIFLLLSVNLQAAEKQYVIKSGAAPSLTNAGVFLAKELGYFEEQGLNVKLISDETAGASQTILLTSGQLDTGSGGFSAGLWNAINKGEEIKLVACKSYNGDKDSHWALLVRKDLVESGRYKTLKDLKGFTMTLPALEGSAPEVLHDAFIKAGGLNPGDVKVVKMRYGDVNAAFQGKLIDATLQNEPYTTKSVLDGNAVVVSKANEIASGDWQGASIFYSPSFIKDHRDLAEKWMIAYLKAIRAYNDAFFKNINKTKIIDALKKHIQIEDDRIWQQATPALINPNGYLKIKSIDEGMDWFLQKGYITQKPDINKIVDHSFVENAIKLIGEYN